MKQVDGSPKEWDHTMPRGDWNTDQFRAHLLACGFSEEEAGRYCAHFAKKNLGRWDFDELCDIVRRLRQKLEESEQARRTLENALESQVRIRRKTVDKFDGIVKELTKEEHEPGTAFAAEFATERLAEFREWLATLRKNPEQAESCASDHEP
jgi:hypothetical protein